ncbi:MAG: hypothetical protein KGM18_12870, partial [Sphingomonadales bacterium]|nr:hypothetical protein [Sphingomonadales bacterium]
MGAGRDGRGGGDGGRSTTDFNPVTGVRPLDSAAGGDPATKAASLLRRSALVSLLLVSALVVGALLVPINHGTGWTTSWMVRQQDI